MALVTVSNNSLTAVTALPASAPTGALTLIKSITASSSASISFVDGASDVVLDGTYKSYIFKFIDIHPATDAAEFQFNVSIDSGSNYNVTKTSTFFSARHSEDDSSEVGLTYFTADDLAQSTNFQNIYVNAGNGNDECVVGNLQIFSPNSDTFVKHFISRMQGYHNANSSFEYHIAGYANTTSAVNAIQFKMSSGNIDSGIIKLYGVL